MLCKKCGANVLDGIKFCPNCGSSLEEVPVTNIDINNVQDTYTNSVNNSEQNSVVTPVASSVQNTVVTPVTSSVQNTVVEPISVPQQPINNVPPVIPVNNGNMYNNVNNVPSNGNKSNSGLGFVIGAIVVAAIVCAVIIISATMKNDEDGDNSNSNSNSSITSNVASNSNTVSNIVSNSNLVSNITSNVTSNITSNVTSNMTSNVTSNITSNITSNVTSNVTSNTTGNTVKFGGFALQVPTEFVVSSNSTSQLQLIGSNHKDVALIDISEGDLRQLKSNTAYINSYYKSLGYTITKNATTKVYNGTEFVVIEVSKNNIPVISAYAQLAGGKILRVSLSSTDYVLNYNLLNLFATTVKTAKISK